MEFSYEIKRIEYLNKPQIKDAQTLTQFANVTVGIVGQPYDGFTTTYTDSVDFSNTGLDAIQIEQFVDAELLNKMKIKYPNIEL
jgi:hypothetical protein